MTNWKSGKQTSKQFGFSFIDLLFRRLLVKAGKSIVFMVEANRLLFWPDASQPGLNKIGFKTENYDIKAIAADKFVVATGCFHGITPT